MVWTYDRRAPILRCFLQVHSMIGSCVQRVVLLSFDKDTERISFRHYGISAAPSGVTKSVKSLVNRRQLPNMGALGDVSELLTKSGYGSVSPLSQTRYIRPSIACLEHDCVLCELVVSEVCSSQW